MIKPLSIFLTIADTNSNGEISSKKLGLSRKQYYSRISAMVETDLIKRHSGRYYLTPFGKVIYSSIMIIKNALNNYYILRLWRLLKALTFQMKSLANL
jgi:predicted transcriptional regulator